MKMSFRFRLSAVACAAMLFIVAFSFISTPVLADKAGNAAKAAEKAVAKAEALAGQCLELRSAAQRADFERRQALKRAKDAAGTAEAEALEKEAQKAVDKDAAASTAANVKCGEAEEARKKAEEAIKKAEELLKEKTDRGGNVKDDENLDDKLKGLKERLPKRPEQATVVPPSAGQPTQTRTGNGLHTVNFDTSHGRVVVNLPDDMRAGDTISGTVYAEPKGQTEEERAKSLAGLNGYTIMIRPQPAPGKAGDGGFKLPVKDPNFIISLPPTFAEINLCLEPATIIQDGIPGPVLCSLPPTPTVGDSSPTPGFSLPSVGQQGRPVEIFGPFDGDASNTTFRFNPIGSATQDLEKRPETVVGGYGPLKPLAESPRKIVFESPTNFTGPSEIVVKEGSVETKGNYRNLGVSLSAPKTNLTRGERTTLTVEVKGLEGIRENVPLQLDSKGVIDMDGGNFQNLLIKPQDIQPGGRYTTTRAITGQQAGVFNVTATVIVRRFDMCLQDDRNQRSGLLWNSFTGDYVFVNPGPAGQSGAPGGKLQPGGGAAVGGAQTGREGSVQPGGINLTGIGKPAMKGCIITLSHNAPDRRVFARLDVCTKTGSGEVQPSAQKTTLNITDSNTADNACPGK